MTYGKLRTACWLMAVALAVTPLTAAAARLGKLAVFSTFDQPLRAEIDVTATEEEFPSLAARLVHLDNLGSERSENALVASGIRFTPDRRANGQPYLRVTSDKPLREQFIDMFIEVRWTGGRRVHEYSFLLEAPDVFQKPNAVAAPVKKDDAVTLAPPRAAEPAPAAKSAEEPAPTPAAEASAPKPAAAAEKGLDQRPARAAEAVATRRVEKGDTLGKIAEETRVEGASFFQMLVALFSGNGHAFISGNMNRMRAGEILSIPGREVVVSIDRREARSIFVAQAIEYDAYRKMLAESVAKGPGKTGDEAAQAADGKVTVQGAGKTRPSGATPDKLEISRAEAVRGGGAASVEDQIAMGKALEEANSRIAELERNLSDLKKLAAMNAAMAGKAQEAVRAGSAGQAPQGFFAGNAGLALSAVLVALGLAFLAYRSSNRKRAQAARALRMAV